MKQYIRYFLLTPFIFTLLGLSVSSAIAIEKNPAKEKRKIENLYKDATYQKLKKNQTEPIMTLNKD